MTVKQTDAVKRLKLGEITDVGQVTIKRDRGQYIVSKGRFVKTYKDSEFVMMVEKVDELNTETDVTEKTSYRVKGTNLTVIKARAGYEIWDGAKQLQGKMTEEEVDIYIKRHKEKLEDQKVDNIRKNLVVEHKMNKQKKILLTLILFLSSILLVLTFGLGIKFDGVAINRVNNDLYITIKDLAEAKHPEKRMDKFDAVYYTLNYHAQKDTYYMIPKTIVDVTTTEVEGQEPVVTETTRTLPTVRSALYVHYVENLGMTDISMKNDNTYSGVEFNDYFKNEFGDYVNKTETIRRVGFILGHENITTMEDLVKAYLVWDHLDVKSNRAYNHRIDEFQNTEDYIFDRQADYFTNYLNRNAFIRIFLNDSSKFVHEYLLFGSIGWLTLSSFVVLILYIILATALWIFKSNNLKTSKFLTRTIVILTIVVVSPLILQFVFEGLGNEANELLSVIEKSRYTTTTTLMNFIFDYIIKFGNIVLTGILTVGLPLKVIRFFVHNKLAKTETTKRISRVVAPGTVLSEDISAVDWRL